MRSALRRQSFLGPSSDLILGRAIVGVVGLCGGGSHICQQLAHVGFQNFRLFDPDLVEEPNLNRMVGSSPSDATEGKRKTDVVRDHLSRIQPNADIAVFPATWQHSHQALRDCTIVFGCLDSFAQRDELEAYCRRYMLPYIDIGMDVHHHDGQFGFFITGQVILSMPGEPCMRCMGFVTEERIAKEVERYGAAGDRPQVVWPNGVLASTAIGIAVSLLTPWDTTHVVSTFVEYDGNRQTLRPSNAMSTLRGRACTHYPALEVGDQFWGANLRAAI